MKRETVLITTLIFILLTQVAIAGSGQNKGVGPFQNKAISGELNDDLGNIDKKINKLMPGSKQKQVLQKKIISELTGSMKTIPAGCFQMGNRNDKEDHGAVTSQAQICLNEFRMMSHEVTRGQFRSFVNATSYISDAEKKSADGNGCYMSNSDSNTWGYVSDFNWKKTNFYQDDSHPVVCVSYNDATAFAKWLSKETGKRFRLPTEAEWEYATRFGTENAFYWGKDPDHSQSCDYGNGANLEIKTLLSHANDACHDGFKFTAPIKTFKPNGYGLYDMSGNVWEWTCSSFHQSFDDSDQCGQNSDKRTLRGGSWDNDPGWLRWAKRGWIAPGFHSDTIGFRLAQDI